MCSNLTLPQVLLAFSSARARSLSLSLFWRAHEKCSRRLTTWVVQVLLAFLPSAKQVEAMKEVKEIAVLPQPTTLNP